MLYYTILYYTILYYKLVSAIRSERDEWEISQRYEIGERSALMRSERDEWGQH